jgi:hypothetical protein
MSLMLLGILNSQAAGGGGGAYDLLETTTLTSSASSVTFSGLDSYSDYAHLQIRFVARSDRSNNSSQLVARMNGNFGNNYASHRLKADGSTVGSQGYSSTDGLYPSQLTAANNTSGAFGSGVLDLIDAFSTTKNTTARNLGGYTDPGNNKNSIQFTSGLYISTDLLTSFEFFDGYGDNFVAGSRFSLYGIKGA